LSGVFPSNGWTKWACGQQMTHPPKTLLFSGMLTIVPPDFDSRITTVGKAAIQTMFCTIKQAFLGTLHWMLCWVHHPGGAICNSKATPLFPLTDTDEEVELQET
jgi:hypothetical protein